MIRLHRHDVEVLDWLGVGLVIGAYTLAVLGVILATDVIYLLANMIGCGLIAYGSYRKKDRQPMVLNLILLTIALVGLIRIHG